jgi:hypothetical protein
MREDRKEAEGATKKKSVPPVSWAKRGRWGMAKKMSERGTGSNVNIGCDFKRVVNF